jgi:hypothetical protein
MMEELVPGVTIQVNRPQGAIASETNVEKFGMTDSRYHWRGLERE